MKVAVLGSGNICGNLGRLLVRAGHEVLFASRHPEDLTMLVAQAGPRAMAGGLDDAFAFSDVVAEALPYAAVLHLSADKLACKILISSLNYYPQREGEIDRQGLSQTKLVAVRLPETRVETGFNMLYFKELEARLSDCEAPAAAMIMAGDDADAKRIVAGLIRDAKFEPVDAGGLAAGRLSKQAGHSTGTRGNATRSAKGGPNCRKMPCGHAVCLKSRAPSKGRLKRGDNR